VSPGLTPPSVVCSFSGYLRAFLCGTVVEGKGRGETRSLCQDRDHPVSLFFPLFFSSNPITCFVRWEKERGGGKRENAVDRRRIVSRLGVAGGIAKRGRGKDRNAIVVLSSSYSLVCASTFQTLVARRREGRAGSRMLPARWWGRSALPSGSSPREKGEGLYFIYVVARLSFAKADRRLKSCRFRLRAIGWRKYSSSNFEKPTMHDTA